MLPDGAHNRSQEVTYFMIRKANVDTDSTEEFQEDDGVRLQE
jgi:hypothetical protein